MSALTLSPVHGRNQSVAISQRAKAQLLLNAIQFCAWVAQARPGESLEYHRGLLALDGSEWSQDFAGDRRRELNRLARRAWWAAEQGLVHLVQRRNAPDDFSYIAIARPRTAEASASLSSILLKESDQ